MAYEAINAGLATYEELVAKIRTAIENGVVPPKRVGQRFGSRVASNKPPPVARNPGPYKIPDDLASEPDQGLESETRAWKQHLQIGNPNRNKSKG